MAEGDKVKIREAIVYESVIAAVAVSDGMGWVDTSGFAQAIIHVEGITTATVQFRGSNQTAQPGLTDDEVPISEVTANGMTTLTGLPRWLKVKVSAWTTGTVNCYTMLRP